MDEVKQLVEEIQKGKLHPIYFLMGKEAYYIDKISNYIAENVLAEEERGFNQIVMYGKESSIGEVVENAKRYPMMAEKQVLIVKEAQHLSRNIEQLSTYVLNPQPSTVLVICYKYKELDKRKKLYKNLAANNAVIFESKLLYENQVSEWIRKTLKAKGYAISHKAIVLLVDYLGTDLSKVNNEIEKLLLVLPENSEITPETIEEHIGISKDYNQFELKKAIGEKNMVKATRIINYFSSNPKENPFVLTVPSLHTFFSRLLKYHGLTDHSTRNVASALGINSYFVSEYQTAARNYPMKKVSSIVSSLREMDLKGKGVGASNLSQADLLKELLTKII